MELVNGSRADMNSHPLGLLRWRAIPPTASITWAAWLLLAVMHGGFCFASLSGLCAEPVFERYEFLTDCDAAKVVSRIDLYAIATNLWGLAEDERAGKFIVRAALDKSRYQIGEPVHLFIYRLHHSTEYTLRPKSADWEIIRPMVVDHRNRLVQLTPAGEWHASFSNLFVTSRRWFPTNQVKMSHIDLTELVNLAEPGEYQVFPRILLDMQPGTLEQPASAELRAVPFEVTSTRFERPTNAPSSSLAAMYQQDLDKLAGRVRPLTEL